MSTPPIAFAVMGGDLELVKSRVQAGADINEVTNRGTALHVACIYKRTEIARYLLENGANPQAKDQHGQLPIDVADDETMVALLREFGVQELGIYDHNMLERENQPNAFILASKNDLNLLAEMIDPLDTFLGFYSPRLSFAHLQSLQESLQVAPVEPDSAIVTQPDGRPRLFPLDSHVLRSLELSDDQLLDQATVISKSRPFKKMPFWDKYTVFLLLCNLRALSYISKKRKLRLFFQQWDLPTA